MLNLNKEPYYDDYRFEKNFKKVLFKPGLPVQTRELNQLQSIFKGELGALSDHVFKNGSKVSNCRCSLFRRDYVRLMDTDALGNVLSNPLIKAKLVGETSGVEAVLTNFIEPVPTTLADDVYEPTTINVIYTKNGIDSEQSKFIHGETILVYTDNGTLISEWIVRCPECVGSNLDPEISPTGKSYYYGVDEGIVYYNQMFGHVAQQEVLITKYVTTSEDGYDLSNDKFKVGLDVNVGIVTANDDPTLLDNSLGYPNASAEGADRLKITLTLVKRQYDAEDGDTFIVFAKYAENYTAEYTKADSEYNELLKEFARRTFETAGNFTVAPFLAQFLNEKKQTPTDTKGYAVTGNDDNLVAIVGPGIAYVEGYRVEKTGESVVPFSKARDTSVKQKFAATLDNRQYVHVNVESTNVIINNENNDAVLSFRDIVLYDGPIQTGDVSGQIVGTLKVTDQSFVKDNEYILYVYNIDITKDGLSFKDVKSMKTQDSSFIASAKLVNNAWPLYNSDSTGLVYKLPISNIKTLRSSVDKNAGSITFKSRRKLTGTLDSSGKISFTGTTNEYFEGYNPFTNIITLGGVRHELQNNEFNVNNNTLDINVGATHASKKIVILVDVTRFNQTEKTKILKTSTSTTTGAPSGVKNTVIKLGVADGYDVVSLTLVHPSDPNFNKTDVTSEYTFDGGQRDMYYGECTLTRNTARSNIDNSLRLEISFRYFEHEGTQGYFTVDSYNQLLNDGVLKYAEIPTHNIDGTDVKLNECVDFRPILIDGQYAVKTIIPVPDSTFVCDLEHYLPRVDTLQLSREGLFSIKQGIPSESPVAPDADVHNMKIYDIYMAAYVYGLHDVDIRFIENKRFTMRDIGKIDSRLTNLEYYVTLNMLEQKTLNQNITDSNGLNRFKNGFLVDNFQQFFAADLTNDDFKASLDRKRGELRPSFDMFNVPLSLDTTKSNNVNLSGNVATLPFVEVPELVNPFATKAVSINPYLVFNKTGSVILTPNIDTWADDTHLPEVVSTVDTGAKALQDLASFNKLTGTDWGSWQNMNTTVQSTTNVNTESSNSFAMEGGTGVTNTTTTTTDTSVTRNDRREGVSRSISSRTDAYTITDNVKDVRIVPYIRSKVIDFYASNLKANTRIYVMFDGIDVTEHCRPKVQTDTSLTASKFVNFGSVPLVVDLNGEFLGEFRIPEKMFFTGEKSFVITDSITATTDPTTTASTKYFAGGVSQTKQSSTLNIVSPVVTSRNVVDERTNVTTSRDEQVTQSTQFTPAPRPPVQVPVDNGRNDNVVSNVIQESNDEIAKRQLQEQRAAADAAASWQFVQNWLMTDPVAQSFQVEESCFVTSIDIFLASVDTKTSDNIWVELRTMANGYPSSEVIVHKDYSPSELVNSVSADSTGKFRVMFNTPIYVDSGKVYCFVIGGHSPDTKLWVARLGEEVINIPGKIVEEPPSLHASFRSLNGTTWNAEQYEFIKYTINRAEFTETNMQIAFKNDNVAKFKTEMDPIEVENGSNRVRIHVKNHGVTVNDKVDFSLYDGIPFTIEVSNNTAPQIGQLLKTVSGRGTISTIEATALSEQYIVTLENVTGTILTGESYQCDPLVKNFNDYILFANGNTSRPAIQVTECQGIVVTDIRDSLGFTTISQVDLAAFNAQHIVVEVDGPDSFIIEVPGMFIKSGRFGGKALTIYNLSRKFESYNVSAEFIEYTSNSSFELTTIDSEYNYSKPNSIKMNATNYLDRPAKFAGTLDENRVLGAGNTSTQLVMKFVTGNRRISPVINLDTVTLTGISNNIGWITKEKFNVSPNAADRLVSETKDNGSESYRYLTNKVTLKNPASDIKIYADVYKDVDADFDIYVKYGNGESIKDESTPWVLLDKVNKDKISSGVNQFIEYEVTLSGDSTAYNASTEFIWFRTKLVGRAKNSAKPTMFKNLRVIAVT